MTIYEARGFSNTLHLFDKIEPFEYIAKFKPMVVPQGVDLEEFKRTQAPYCLSGKVKPDTNGSYKRNNASLVYRDLIFLDYDDLETGVDLPKIVSEALSAFSYIIYPTIKHTAKKQRFRLVIKPSNVMNEATYKQVVTEIAKKIGLPYDTASLTWSQLQGLPVTTGDPADYQIIVNRGYDYIVPSQPLTDYPATAPLYTDNRQPKRKSMTMRVIDTLLHGFGNEGERNVALTRFVGLLLNKWVDCDVETAYELAQIANSVTNKPIPQRELDRTFESIVKSEIRKRSIR
ncbi:primase alpha helix C-terminal domain-containing protein [Streptococcus suis]|uniref:primase alpha helix C-terminal domain-containing protein n=1 Tax=Streptococcus suis TaxID=1307 RepID=UPI001583CA15|nr:primase alpha helix C-terminal domain-containing protein [Streptococcus suis]MCG9883370.1 primase alpha helix C-terminal domain-containing protein [Streptococcus suis]MCG9907547.1 primase alpha helix C-terminal domain-containing protein [Streptococcus suis]MCG9931989.1 primase alpha helix C-terminal domain-containing protein [Streptococcus suis]